MQVSTLFQTDNHASTPTLCFFRGRMPFLPHSQQGQCTEGNCFNSEGLMKSLFLWVALFYLYFDIVRSVTGMALFLKTVILVKAREQLVNSVSPGKCLLKLLSSLFIDISSIVVTECAVSLCCIWSSHIACH